MLKISSLKSKFQEFLSDRKENLAISGISIFVDWILILLISIVVLLALSAQAFFLYQQVKDVSDEDIAAFDEKVLSESIDSASENEKDSNGSVVKFNKEKVENKAMLLESKNQKWQKSFSGIDDELAEQSDTETSNDSGNTVSDIDDN